MNTTLKQYFKKEKKNGSVTAFLRYNRRSECMACVNNSFFVVVDVQKVFFYLLHPKVNGFWEPEIHKETCMHSFYFFYLFISPLISPSFIRFYFIFLSV